MSIESVGEIAGLVVTALTLLGLLVRYVFLPLKRFTKKLKSNSKQIVESLPLLFAMYSRWPLEPQSGSLINLIESLQSDLNEVKQLSNKFLKDYPCGIFICDVEGRNKHVNRTYARWLEVGEDELLGYGWKVFQRGASEREEYEREWKEAFADGRELEFQIEMRTSEFEHKTFDVKAYPIFNKDGTLLEYFGILLEKHLD